MSYMIVETTEGKIEITRTCPFCDKVQQVKNIEPEQFKQWKEGALIQNVFPELSADEREVLMTGICSTCWEEV